MPNRDHDDSYYNRNEGRFESARDERDDYRDRSYPSSREWERRDDRSFFTGGSNYNPARDDNDYRGGNRYEERSYQSAQPLRQWDEQQRWRDQLTRGSGRDQYSAEYSPQQQTWRGGYGAGRPSFYNPNSPQNRQGNFGGAQDWNRDYTRDWDRDYRGDQSRSRGFDTRSSYGRSDYGRSESNRNDDNDWGESLRHAGAQFVGKVKRAFRGPKGYKRSDERIREDISDRLALQDEIDPSEIEVQVQNGDVTLSGTVRSRHEKFRAEEIADDVVGVNDVSNQIRVGSAQQQQGTSTTTTTSAQSPVSRNGRA